MRGDASDSPIYGMMRKRRNAAANGTLNTNVVCLPGGSTSLA